MDGAGALDFPSVFFLALPHTWAGGGGWGGERRGGVIKPTSTPGQETGDSNSDPAFLSVINPKFFCGV